MKFYKFSAEGKLWAQRVASEPATTAVDIGRIFFGTSNDYLSVRNSTGWSQLWDADNIDALSAAIAADSTSSANLVPGLDPFFIRKDEADSTPFTVGFGAVNIGSDNAIRFPVDNTNLAIGPLAGTSLTAGATENVAIGYQSTYWNQTGDSNVAVGYFAGFSAIGNSYDYNVFIGNRASYSITTGGSNVAIGYQASFYNQTGANNAIIGYQAGFGVTGQSYASNVIIGYQAGFAVTTSSNNVFIGYNAARGNTTGNHSTIIGYYAGRYNETGFNNVIVGKEAAYGTSGNSYGDNTIVGHQSAFWITTASDNTFMGYRAAYYNLTGASNVCIGLEAGFGASGQSYSNNTFVGYQSGYSTTTGGSNVFMGFESGYYPSGGTQNVAIGYQAFKGSSGFSGSQNTVVGNQAGYSNRSGGTNSFFGYQAGFATTNGSSNVCFGYSAGRQNVTGNANTLVGKQAGYGVAANSYSNNVFLGYQSGYSMTTGSDNVFIGYQAGYSETTSNKLYIDNSNTATPLIYGDFSTNALTINGTLGFAAGTTINEFSIDGTLGGNSDNAVPTEKAVKTYTGATFLGISAKAADSNLLDAIDSGGFARYAATPTASNQLSSAAWVAAWSSSANIDHIWHDDSGNIWHFCSDTTFKATANSTVRAATFNEGGTSLSAKYLGISAQAANSALLGGAAASEAASNSTIVKRTSAGYIYAGYFNMTAGDVSSGITKLACEVGTDSFLRWGTLAGVVTFLAGSFLGLTAKAADSNLLDNVNSSQFLRSDAADIVTAGGITFNDNIFLNIGTGADLEFWNNGSNSYIDINNGQNLYMRDGNSSNATRFTFDIDTGNLTATTFTGTATAAKYS